MPKGFGLCLISRDGHDAWFVAWCVVSGGRYVFDALARGALP
jgi:hypothetical protein